MTNNPQSPTSDVPDGEIIEVLQSGYSTVCDMGEALDALRATYNVTITRKP